MEVVVAGDLNTKDQAKAAINGISAGGMTSIGAGLQRGWSELQRFPDDPVRAMLLMSDGKHNTSPHPNNVIPGIDNDVLIYTIGFGGGADAMMLSNIASQRNGNYYFAPSENELREIYFAISGRLRGDQLGLSATGTATTGSTGHLLTVDASVTTARIGVDWSGSDLDLSLVNPVGEIINHGNVDQYSNITLEVGNTYEIYLIENPMPGHWEMLVDPIDVPPGGEEYRAYALFATPIAIDLRTDKDIYLQGDAIEMLVNVSDPAPITGATVEGIITAPGVPDPYVVPLYDDGAHDDGAADDGVYGGDFTVTRYPGSYRVQAEARGTSNAGYVFERVIWQSVVVNPAHDPDGDGMPSDWEIANGLDPITWDADGDPDGDNLPNITEYQQGTNPQKADTDDDGWNDDVELAAGSDPLNPNSVPMDDVTSQVDIGFSQLRWNRLTQHSSCPVTITNIGTTTLGPMLHFAIGNIIPPNITLANADGTTQWGDPYIDIGAIVGTAGLAPGEAVTATLEFHNADRERFAMEYSLLVNRPLPSQTSSDEMMMTDSEDEDQDSIAMLEQKRLEAIIEGYEPEEIPFEYYGMQPSGTLASDMSGNRQVNIFDHVLFAPHWLRTDCSENNNWCEGADFNKDGNIDIYDLAIMTNEWLHYVKWE